MNVESGTSVQTTIKKVDNNRFLIYAKMLDTNLPVDIPMPDKINEAINISEGRIPDHKDMIDQNEDNDNIYHTIDSISEKNSSLFEDIDNNDNHENEDEESKSDLSDEDLIDDMFNYFDEE